MKISAWTISVVSQHSVRIISVVWLNVNNLSLNIKAHLWYSHKNTHPCCSQYWSSTISEVSITNYIRVYVGSHLKWKKPIDNTADKLSWGIGLVAKDCKLFNSEAVIKYSGTYLCYCYDQSTKTDCTAGTDQHNANGKIGISYIYIHIYKRERERERERTNWCQDISVGILV